MLSLILRKIPHLLWIIYVKVVQWRYYLGEDRDMTETEEELLELFDGLDEAGQLMALEAARKIKNGEGV